MTKYLSLCNWHLSIHGDSVALFEGSDYGTSKGGYTSDIRHAYLFDEGDNRHDDEVMVDISKLYLTEADFYEIRQCKIPHYLMKDYIIRNTDFTYPQVCKFEKERNEEEDRAKKYGYCKLNGGICEGEECDQYALEDWTDKNECADNIEWILCQED